MLAMWPRVGMVSGTMQFRSAAPALAAVLILGCPMLALAQATPAPTASPGQGTSVLPNAMSSAAPAADPAPTPRAESTAAPGDEASPSPQPSSGQSLRGTLMSIKGTLATVKLANGTLQTYTVTAKAAAVLKKSLGKKLLFKVVHGALDVLPH
jgi:hypothetical protein